VVAPSVGEVVLVPFPFSDLSQSKLRPAVCLADAGRGDWVLCQITSSPYGDPSAVPLDATDFTAGGLLVASFARPGKLLHRQRRPHGEICRHPISRRAGPGALGGRCTLAATIEALTPNEAIQRTRSAGR
jgi:mRNA interferase MazF